MELLNNIINWGKARFSNLAPSVPTPTDTPIPLANPTEEMVQAALAQAGRASAAIADAYGRRATTFMVTRHDEHFLITNAHTTNRHQGSTAFHYKNRKYFPIIKGDQIAFAEHLALNPQGLTCSPEGKGTLDQPFQDISILRLVSPEQTRTMLYDLAFGPDSKARLQTVFTIVPGVISPGMVGNWTAETLQKITQDFSLEPLPDIPKTAQANPTTLYSIAHHRNKPIAIESTRVPHSKITSGIGLKFATSNPINPGHSGGVLFSIDGNGRINPQGMISHIVDGSPYAQAVDYQRILAGIDIVIAKKTLQATNLQEACAIMPGQDIWLDADAIQHPLPTVNPQPQNTAYSQR